MSELDELRERCERLAQENAICREAVEQCYQIADGFPGETDSDAAVRRVTMRRLNEAIGVAAPRLLMERPEGQKLYGLRYRELADENKALGTRCEQQAAEIERLRELLTEARRWIGDGDQSEGLDRQFWTPEHAAVVDMMDAALAEQK